MSAPKAEQRFTYCIQRADGSYEEGEAVVQADGRTIVRTVLPDVADARPAKRSKRPSRP
jgi:hypothetical protein